MPMAEIVAMSAYRAAHARISRSRERDRSRSGAATLLLFTGVRREAIDAGEHRKTGSAKGQARKRHGEADR